MPDGRDKIQINFQKVNNVGALRSSRRINNAWLGIWWYGTEYGWMDGWDDMV